jgi:rhodanese-related sulfurtransferase
MGENVTVRHLAADEVASLLREGRIVLVDVREPAEFAAERIEGAVLHPLSSFDPAALPAGEVVFSCGVGQRSLTAIQRAVAAGLPHAAHLAGGLRAWKQAGLPTHRG